MPWQKKVRGKLSKKRYGTGTVPYLPDQTKSTRYSKNFWSGQADAYRPKLSRIYITYLHIDNGRDLVPIHEDVVLSTYATQETHVLTKAVALFDVEVQVLQREYFE